MDLHLIFTADEGQLLEQMEKLGSVQYCVQSNDYYMLRIIIYLKDLYNN